MMIASEEGFSLGSMNDFFDEGDDAQEISMDVESFFTILNEENENSEPLQINPFHSSTENNQEYGSALHTGYQENIPFQIDCGAVSENSPETMEVVGKYQCPSMEDVRLADANQASFSQGITDPSLFQLHHDYADMSCQPSTRDWLNEFNTTSFLQSFPDGANYDFMLTNGLVMSDMNACVDDSHRSRLWLDCKIPLEGQLLHGNINASNIPTCDIFDSKGIDTVNTYESCSSSSITDEASAEPFLQRLVGKSLKKLVETDDVKNHELLERFERKSVDVSKETAFSGVERYLLGAVGGSVHCHSPTIDRKAANLWLLEEYESFSNLNTKFSSSCPANEGEYRTVQPISLKDEPFSTLEATRASLSNHKNEDDDDDICIIEDMNQRVRIHPSSTSSNSIMTSPCSNFGLQSSAIATPLHHSGVGGTRLKANDERLVFQALVQDLSQPKTEATPPDGVLAVPLLRHQQIALSWMVQKETNSLQCSGGILADDQGLGKTVSTIALILTERPLLSKKSNVTELSELETLDLDEDDECQTRERNSVDCLGKSLSKGRPSAGTLIVCPTSVLRQWAEELNNKVTTKANLSVLVYHGSNRIKDPYELAKFDVVLTTYSIVSMEVPKQPVVIKGGTGKRKSEADEVSIWASKKRKLGSNTDKKSSKRDLDATLNESLCPLARVSWFRVVLDEAQSIKNHKTRVAQACWGLRAKRRWCLSGTPIQNAVDDLYSYFRFLKYDPYSVYNSFCSMVKFPINKNPSSGYRKLQAVLKGIMLRRTKGTKLDGQPIINLPPKYIKLKKVEFSEKERDFYSKLEDDSRAQFQAYADSGTVKQNYVNILLLLLRLRQACDHPFLVQGYDSHSALKSAIHEAKKLPRDHQICLLNCLEGSLAICHICNDAPEDAVVSTCKHVFCNQCISEHLTGDDNQCPAAGCKTQISISEVFSKATLNSCLDQSCQDNFSTASASETSNQSKLVESQLKEHYDSSKIKAALEVLQSLDKPVGVSDSHLLVNAKALPALDNRSSEARNGWSVKEKAIVFSQWTRMLDLLETCLKGSSIEYRRLDGTMSVAARDKAVKDFNTLPEVTVIIMSLKAASLGLNMVAACHVILLDLWWNPTTEDQAIDRAHRIGQTRPVTVVRLTVKDTVEDRILALQQRKRELVASAFGEDETGSRQTRLTVEDLKYLFRG